MIHFTADSTFRGRRRWAAGLAWALGALLLAVPARAQAVAPNEPHIIVTSPGQRDAYLARASIWQERKLPSPAAIVEGPPMPGGATRAQLNPPDGIPCAYESGGARMGGRTPKFTCRMPDGRSIRVKYYSGDPEHGNREVFAEVITTRLFWALGFYTDTVYPLTVSCEHCPEDPMKGTGLRATRKYLGVTEPPFKGMLILSKADPDQGWKFGEIEDAIEALPPGPDRERQQTRFDALRLLAAFVQHGDRKSEQQRLVCVGEVDQEAGDVHPLSEGDGGSFSLPALFERPGAAACPTPVIMVQDLGATLGSSGRFTSRTDKVHLGSWIRRPVFHPVTGRSGTTAPSCRVELTAAMTAGGHATVSAPVGEPGRQFLADQLARLTDAHIRALFEAGRVEALGEPFAWTDPDTGTAYSGIDAWVAAFKHKRATITEARCPVPTQPSASR
jgi:hypothetical protein